MYYYSNPITKLAEETILTIDTRGSKPIKEAEENFAKDEDNEEDETFDPLERAIQSK